MNKPIILGRVLPKSGKIHQNQEVYHTGGVIPTLKASGYKDPFKIMEEYKHDKSKTNS